MTKQFLLLLLVLTFGCLNTGKSEEERSKERSNLTQILNTGSGSSSDYYIDNGYSTSSNTTNEWSFNYIANLSSGDCKAIASGDRFYCTTNDCRGIVTNDRFYCKTSDCKGVASGDRFYCKSRLCKAWASRDRFYCDSSDYDCKAIASGDPFYCRSRQCKAIVRRDRFYCN